MIQNGTDRDALETFSYIHSGLQKLTENALSVGEI